MRVKKHAQIGGMKGQKSEFSLEQGRDSLEQSVQLAARLVSLLLAWRWRCRCCSRTPVGGCARLCWLKQAWGWKVTGGLC